MVFIDIRSIDGDKVTASYRPEKENARPGTITYDMQSENMVGVDRSPDDDAPLSWYAMGAIYELRRMLADTPIRMHGKNIWH